MALVRLGGGQDNLKATSFGGGSSFDATFEDLASDHEGTIKDPLYLR